MKKSIKSSSRSRIRTCTYSPTLNVQDVKTPINSEVNADSSEAELQQLMNDIKSAISTKLHRIMTSEEFGFEDSEVDDYSRVEVSSATIGEDDEETIRVEVRVELSYDGMLDVKEGLDPIVESYDSYAYFDFDEPGIMSAYVRVEQVDMSVYGATASPDHMFYDYHGKRFSVHDNSSELRDDVIDDVYYLWKANVSQQAGAYNDADEDYVYAFIRGQGVVEYYKKGKYVATSNYNLRDEDDFEQAWEYMEIILQDVCDRLIAYNKDVPDRMVYNSTYVEASDSYNLDDETYEYVTNVDGYWVYRAVVDGKGVWRAMPQGSNESYFEELSFPISYDQARGFEPINEPAAITKLRKDLGKKLLPKAGQSVEATDMEPGSSDIEMGICSDKEDITSSTDEVYYPNGQVVPDDSVDMDKFLDYNFGTDRDPDNSHYTTEEKQRAVDYYFKKEQKYAKASSNTDDRVFIEDIIDGLEDNGYDLTRISSIKRGIWELFGYKEKDADIIIHDLIAGGFIDPNNWVDKDYIPSIYSSTEEDSSSRTNSYDYCLGDIVSYNGDVYVIIDDEDNLLTLRPKDRFGDNDFENPELGDSSEDIFLEPWQLADNRKVTSASEYDEDLLMVDQEYDPYVEDIEYTMMNELPSWFNVQGNGLHYNVSYDGHTVHLEFIKDGTAKYVYYIDETGPYATDKSENINFDLQDYFDGLPITSATEEDDEDLPMVDQEYDSAATSINSNKLPAIYKMVSFNEGDVVVDFGGGKFDNAVEYIRDKGATLCVYDPYNRSAEHNKEVLRILRENGGADAAVNSNVLNVIKEPEARKNVLENIARITKPGAPIYITVYEGKGNGQEGPTKSGYQLNRKTADYLEEIQEVFPDATRKGKLITAHNSGSVSSATDIQAANNISYEKYLLNQVRSLLIDKLESEYDIEFFITDMYIDGDAMHIQVYGDDSLHGDVDISVDYSGDVYDFADDAFNKLKDIFQNNSSNTVEGSQDISRYDKEIVSYRKIISKSVEDSDGFLTDYTMYEVVTEDGSVEYECYFGDNDLYGPWNGEGLDFEADNYDEAVEWYNSYSSDEIQSSESVEGSIAPEEFFTKDDLIEFAISVEDEINRRINPKKKFNVSDAYVEGNTVHIEVHNDAYELSGEAAIDMRRIRRPSDIHKYLPTVVDAMINEYNEVRTDEITSSTVLDSNTEFRENFEEAVDIFYEEYPATVELTDEQDEEYDTLYKAYVRETGVLYNVKPGVVYIDIDWDSSDILQALEETAEAIGVEHYPDPLDVDASESIQGDAFSELEDAYLSPPEYDEPTERDVDEEVIELDVDQVIIVDVDGDYEWEDDTYKWAASDGVSGDWRSEDGVYIDDKTGIVEKIDDLISPQVPTRPGKYRVTGDAELVYEVSGILEYKNLGKSEEEYEEEVDANHAAVTYSYRKSEINNLKITPVR